MEHKKRGKMIPAFNNVVIMFSLAFLRTKKRYL